MNVLYIILENILKLSVENIIFILNSKDVMINETELLKSLLLYQKENGPNEELNKMITDLNYKLINLSELTDEEKNSLKEIKKIEEINVIYDREYLPKLKNINSKLVEFIYKIYVKDNISIDCIFFLHRL